MSAWDYCKQQNLIRRNLVFLARFLPPVFIVRFTVLLYTFTPVVQIHPCSSFFFIQQ